MPYQPISPIRTFRDRAKKVNMEQQELQATGRAPTKPSIAGAESTSPSLTSSFSQADRLLIRDSQYTTNTGGRARQSWRNSVGNLWRRPNSTTEGAARIGSYHPARCILDGTTNSSPVDPAIIPHIFAPVVELPASPVAHPDEPLSFFDSGSDTDSENEPILSRASSVRIQRPQLITNISSTSGQNIRVYGPTLATIPSTSEVKQTQNQQTSFLSDATTAIQPSKSDASLASSANGPTQALEALTVNAQMRASTSALPPTPKSHEDFIKQSVIEVPNTPGYIEATSTLPPPMGGFGSLHVPQSSSTRFGASVVDGLRSNPVDKVELAPLHRTASAPPLPSHHLNRKVTIRPSDLVITNTSGEHRLFRQSIVSTPYPARNGSNSTLEEGLVSTMAATKGVNVLPPMIEEKDRFPSPARAEVLLLHLLLSRHPCSGTMIDIEVKDKGTFDDEALFLAIRQSCNKNLLGVARRLFSARSLCHATFVYGSSFDSISFTKHLKAPKLGHKRKSWLMWLRNQQCLPSRHGSSVSPTERYNSFYSPSSLPRMPFLKPESVKIPPQVTLHFEFSLPKIAVAVLSTLVLSCLAAILWVLFGLPGVGAASQPQKMTLGEFGWRRDAEQRVLTGLVLGVLVFLLGTLGNLAWVAGSWVVL